MAVDLWTLIWLLATPALLLCCPLPALISILLFNSFLIYCAHRLGIYFVSPRKMAFNYAISTVPLLAIISLSLLLDLVHDYLSKLEVPWIKLLTAQTIGQSLALCHWYFQTRQIAVFNLFMKLRPGIVIAVEGTESH